MSNKEGISLIALVVTIIVLLILSGITIAVTVGSDGVIEKSKNSKLEARYAALIDKIKIREVSMEIAAGRGEEGESIEDFIERLEKDNLLIPSEDLYDIESNNIISLGLQKDGTYKYSIEILGIATLPDANVPGNEHLKNMTLEVKVYAPDNQILLPISDTTNLLVNWDAKGDPDNFVPVDPSALPAYNYPDPGTYEVQIKGVAKEGTSISNDFEFQKGGGIIIDFAIRNITRIKYWGENGFSAINGFGPELTGTIPIPSKNSFINVIDFNSLFAGSTITGSIPPNLFSNCPKVTSFSNAFLGCFGLSGEIPQTLFDNCPNVTNFGYTFANCTGLTGKAPALWERTNVTYSVRCFWNCANLSNIDEMEEGWY